MNINGSDVEKISVIPIENIKKGDVIVLNITTSKISAAESENLKYKMRRYFPNNEIVILNNIEISIVRQE